MPINAVDFFGPGSVVMPDAGDGPLARNSGVVGDAGHGPAMSWVVLVALLVLTRALYEMAS